MNVIGVVVEYNPFHNGHLYQIKKIRELYEDAVIVVAMSGYFTERGEISVISKWDKAFLALQYGVDIVLEIPFVFSCQSADIFSYAAIKMLSEFKIDTLVFGSEGADALLLERLARVQINNPEFDKLVKVYLDKGFNYPTSLSKATHDLINESVSDPNDVLAISYIKEIIKNDFDISIKPIRRTSDFLDLTSDEVIVSASNIRNKLFNGEDIKKYVPSDTIKYVSQIDYEWFFNLLKYKIISESDRLKSYHLVSEGIDKRIYESALTSNNLEDLINGIKTKRFTYNKINRILINIFIGFTKLDAAKFKSLEYVRVLGFSNNGKKYYSTIKKDFALPVVNKFGKYDMMQMELKVANLYSMLIHNNNLYKDEIKNHVLIK